MIKKKEYKFHAASQDELGLEIMEQDAEKIRQVTPGFHLAPRVLPLNNSQNEPGESKPILNMPNMPMNSGKKEKKK